MNIIKHILILLKPFLIPLAKNCIYPSNFGDVSFKLKGGLGFLCAQRRKKYLNQEEKFLLSLDLKDKTVYDIGGFVGVLTILFAKKGASRVITFEPNPKSCIKLKANVVLNNLDNVQILNIGIADKRETKTLITHPIISGIGSMEKSMQQQLLKGKNESLQVEVDTLDQCIDTNRLPKPDFIKIDIEGMEYCALLGMRETISRYKPSLFVEVHGTDEENKTKNIQRIEKFLGEYGYSFYYVDKEGHIFCKVKL